MLSNKEIIVIRRSLDGRDKKIAVIFKTLSDANRCKIFRILQNEPQLSVGTISKILGISLPLTSQHLKILLHNHLLVKERVGQKAFYKLKNNSPIIQALLIAINLKVKHLDKEFSHL
jgi:ArsR family transcriptional regulator, zinc-responsive transcriptional repressor